MEMLVLFRSSLALMIYPSSLASPYADACTCYLKWVSQDGEDTRPASSSIICIISVQVRSLGSQVRLDARTKLLNPKWYEGMLSSGYEGVREIQKRLTNTVGWSATSGAVDNWVYDEVRPLAYITYFRTTGQRAWCALKGSLAALPAWRLPFHTVLQKRLAFPLCLAALLREKWCCP